LISLRGIIADAKLAEYFVISKYISNFATLFREKFPRRREPGCPVESGGGFYDEKYSFINNLKFLSKCIFHQKKRRK